MHINFAVHKNYWHDREQSNEWKMVSLKGKSPMLSFIVKEDCSLLIMKTELQLNVSVPPLTVNSFSAGRKWANLPTKTGRNDVLGM